MENISEQRTFIRNRISEATLYENLAEECTELAKAALKKARKLRGENPTPKTIEEIDTNIDEEIADVSVCLFVLDLGSELDKFYRKLTRWCDRIEKLHDL